METIELKLTLEEANLILEALGNMPFKDVFELIGKIQNQANEQLQGSAGAMESSDNGAGATQE